MDNDGLTPEQTEKVLQFQDLIGIDDIVVCRDILTRHQWDLEVAIQEQLNLREGRPSMYASSSTDREPQVINDRYLQRIFTSSRDPAPGGLTGIIGFIVNYVFNFCYSTLSSIITTIRDILRGNERSKLLSLLSSEPKQKRLPNHFFRCFPIGAVVTDPLADVLNFIRDYNEKYPNHPVFYQGTYAQVLNDAKRELKFLAVYLHSESSSQTASFCRNTLANEEVIEYVNTNMLLWGCDVSTPEGYRVSHSINARAYPTLVIVGIREHKMVIMGRMEGDCVPAEFLRRVQSVINDNKIWLVQERQQRYNRLFHFLNQINQTFKNDYLFSLQIRTEVCARSQTTARRGL